MLDHGHKGIRNAMKTIRQQYTREFKDQIVELFKLGKTVPQLFEEFGVGTSILYRWVQSPAETAQLGSAASRAVGDGSEADELRRLRREVSHLRLENDILKKAAVILGTQPHSKHAP